MSADNGQLSLDDVLTADKTCTSCRQSKPLGQFPYQVKRGKRSYYGRCKTCRNDLRREKWDQLTPDQKRAAGHKTHKRPLTPAEFAYKAGEQDGRCAICGDTPKPRIAGRPRKDGTRAAESSGLTYDHDHTTGEGRDLLCHGCNIMIGYARDDASLLEAGAEYLRRWAARPTARREPIMQSPSGTLAPIPLPHRHTQGPAAEDQYRSHWMTR